MEAAVFPKIMAPFFRTIGSHALEREIFKGSLNCVRNTVEPGYNDTGLCDTSSKT